jgi:branched-chain amino acid transport system substrate-binding protein
MRRRTFILAAGVAGLAIASSVAYAQEAMKIGLILPLTGPFASIGRQVEAGAKLYIQQIR